jgi:hypothetical protein
MRKPTAAEIEDLLDRAYDCPSSENPADLNEAIMRDRREAKALWRKDPMAFWKDLASYESGEDEDGEEFKRLLAQLLQP